VIFLLVITMLAAGISFVALIAIVLHLLGSG
jgi:hypothetical protein